MSFIGDIPSKFDEFSEENLRKGPAFIRRGIMYDEFRKYFTQIPLIPDNVISRAFVFGEYEFAPSLAHIRAYIGVPPNYVPDEEDIVPCRPCVACQKGRKHQHCTAPSLSFDVQQRFLESEWEWKNAASGQGQREEIAAELALTVAEDHVMTELDDFFKDWLDLHYLRVNTAVAYLKKRLEALKAGEKMSVVTGRGKHSKKRGHSELKNKVVQFLRDNAYVYSESRDNPGLLVVDGKAESPAVLARPVVSEARAPPIINALKQFGDAVNKS